MPDKPSDELINKIKNLYAELRKLEVFPKAINFGKASDAQLETELEAVGEQLIRRKKFLGVE